MSACCRSIPADHLPIPSPDRIERCCPSSVYPPLASSGISQRRIVLKSGREYGRRLWVGESLQSRGVFLRSQSDEGRLRRFSVRFSALEERIGEEKRSGGRRKTEVIVAACVTVVLGVGNRVLYKLALVPLKQYPFFLAQLATFGYVVVYFSILYFRYHAGIVTDEMLSLPKTWYLAVGLLEALGAASGMAAGAILSGASIPILSQTFLVWQLLLSVIFLRRRYRVNQLLGCFLVAVGVIITVASGPSAGASMKEAGIFWTLLMITSFMFQAADTVLKEIIFLDAARQLKGGSVDLFVVNSYGSAFQALFIFLLLPFLSKLWGIPFNQLPTYLKDGAACFLNIGSLSSVPLSVYAFTLPLPYIGVASSLPPGFVGGVIVLFVGLLVYCWTPPVRTTPAFD
ncbi:protein CLT1, chloroplastic-like isoform X2 [Magnolia sinica]|uniref:protein CLT1, chloroplastic-like isoform X2 n=1 Tax=Magnolia sinica TaxID=86752 RepID=UPI002659719F|nr:protein CLT1, chloroplastic-like isoform X2 [Magnolia sinica]